MIGQDPHSIILPLSKQNIMQVFQENTHWQIAFSDYLGNIDCHYPKNKLFSFFQHHQWILPQKTSPNPLINTVICFTDGTKSFKAAYTTCSGLSITFQMSFTSTQQNELYAVLQALQDFPSLLSIVTDCLGCFFCSSIRSCNIGHRIQSPINNIFSITGVYPSTSISLFHHLYTITFSFTRSFIIL